MREVHRHARGMIEHAALVVVPSPRHSTNAVLEVRDRGPPLRLAGREVGTRERRVVRARPAAEEDLQRERGEAARPSARSRGSVTLGAARAPARERRTAARASRGRRTVRDDDQGLEQQRHGPHAEQRLEHDQPSSTSGRRRGCCGSLRLRHASDRERRRRRSRARPRDSDGSSRATPCPARAGAPRTLAPTASAAVAWSGHDEARRSNPASPDSRDPHRADAPTRRASRRAARAPSRTGRVAGK